MNPMRTYVFLFTLAVLLANGGYALGQLGRGKEVIVSFPLLLGSVSAAVFALFVIRKRFRDMKKSGEK
jgi:uncharacterized membrane protein YhaH (DUF805 family)